MRILALDVGERRIGVAAADERTRVAVPLAALTVAGDPVDLIARLVDEQQAGALVVGLPLSLSGALGPQAQRVQAIVQALERRLAVPVHTWDERLSTVEARHRQQVGSRHRSAPGQRRARRSGQQDSLAAAIILQAYLDSTRPSP